MAMYSYVYYANTSLNLSIQLLYTFCTDTKVYMYNVHSVQCMCNDSHFCPPGCHLLYIIASRVSRKNKGKVSQFFGQNVTNDTSTPV